MEQSDGVKRHSLESYKNRIFCQMDNRKYTSDTSLSL